MVWELFLKKTKMNGKKGQFIKQELHFDCYMCKKVHIVVHIYDDLLTLWIVKRPHIICTFACRPSLTVLSMRGFFLPGRAAYCGTTPAAAVYCFIVSVRHLFSFLTSWPKYFHTSTRQAEYSRLQFFPRHPWRLPLLLRSPDLHEPAELRGWWTCKGWW